MNNDEEKYQQCLDALSLALHQLRTGKPDERTETARRFAVTITELEKVYAYFKTWVYDERER